MAMLRTAIQPTLRAAAPVKGTRTAFLQFNHIRSFPSSTQSNAAYPHRTQTLDYSTSSSSRSSNRTTARASPSVTTSESPSNPISTPPSSPPKNPLLKRYSAALTSLSSKTGVPLPSLGLSFLILHELTAILPVVAFYFLFATLGIGSSFVAWVYDVAHDPQSQHDIAVGEQAGTTAGKTDGVEWKSWIRDWYEEGEQRVQRVGKKYGILGYEELSPSTSSSPSSSLSEQETTPSAPSDTDVVISRTGGGASKVADAIAAYVVVKALLPLRIGISIGAAPTFARYTLVPLQRLIRRFRPSKAMK